MPAPALNTVLLAEEAGVLTLTLNRPEVLNAVNEQLARELQEGLDYAAREAEVRCIVLTGAGRGFCSGQDLRERPPTAEPSYLELLRRRYNPVILRLATVEKPVLAAVNGVAAGAGCSLALACDLRFASEQASFIQIFARVGLVPDSGSTYFLPRLVSLGKAFEMAYLADPVDAQEALRLGLVNRVVPAEELMATTLEVARRLAAGPTRAYGLTKRALRHALHAPLEDALAYEAYLQEVAGATADHREGVAAFGEKRPPQFTGA
ncbi:MAG: enoyl-CoA hydratase-related protein [Armatimonadota bacterium]|nr:enoyl-CoA hydratase-related protein [Armatimonadota bacterium]MDR7427047.1 enoyl-CoA hydratase-related protein [Armatimonadota bacterium]MDR7464504.1 enoyl-CoA hydratase-related protein [Armatimonadota bacterium]MDR7468740.1 enoyl-CoA hydratase-related protein [Armatimonadota bacterium]MDR7474815.1 enoyl-CoA hydratase-related protein [Armatimonadota bacterium]